ncbi:unnamed protein product [Durusdinium trenchii]|uniref:alpha-amylase n=1 Tax=Durusdinium trenchii TaxID=1381693 RepID=A0ABP0IU62_9DINO
MLSCTPMTKMAFFLVLRLLSIRAYASAYCPGCAAPRPPALLQLRTREVLHRKDWMLLEHVAGNCLEASAEAHNGIRPSLQPCDSQKDLQKWVYNEDSGLFKHLHGKCLDASARDVNDGLIHMWDCDSSNKNQMWDWTETRKLVKNRYGRCMDAPDPSVPGSGVHMWKCDQKLTNQQWNLVTADSVSTSYSSSSTTEGLSTSTTTTPTPLSAVRNCQLEPLVEGSGCKRLALLEESTFGVGENGQETEGRHRCLEQMRSYPEADSFVHALGRCEIWQCGTRARLQMSAGPGGALSSSPDAIALIASDGSYVMADEAGEMHLSEAFLPEAVFDLKEVEKGVTLKAKATGKFLKAEPGGHLRAVTERWDDWEIFQLEQLDDGISVALKSFHGPYMARQGTSVAANAWQKGPEAAFRIENRSRAAWTGSGQQFMKTMSSTGQLACAWPSASAAVRCCANGSIARDASGCQNRKNFTEAVSICAQRGLTLCTEEQLQSEECGSCALPGEQGQFWTSSVCSPTEALTLRRLNLRNDRAAVFSHLCPYQSAKGGLHGEELRSTVLVKLMEWNYNDVAKECTEFLGPNGFEAVQVAPVTEHILGYQWWVKYQPVSAGLDSRSGTEEELRQMVATCRAAGVQVIVDILLNHMASPCKQAKKKSKSGELEEMPCRGWAGSKFGSRRQQGARGWDAAGPEHFHHQAASLEQPFCKVGPQTGWLCPEDDCTPCDMYELPDFNTELQEVRDMQFKHLEELYHIGITGLRVDAAIYHHVYELADMLNRLPWDLIYQEWWGEYPPQDRTDYVGLYRDVAYRWHLVNRLSNLNASELPQLLELEGGVFGISQDMAVYPFAYHDGRSKDADPEIATYKNGLAFHQQQKFFLSWPVGNSVLIWGGYGWRDLSHGPPGCDRADGDHCSPKPVYDANGLPQCLRAPELSPLPRTAARERRWICEHRWQGVAGLVHFRKACRGHEVTQTWGSDGESALGLGRLAFRLGRACFVALVRGRRLGEPEDVKVVGVGGTWDLKGLHIGVPAGCYCDLSSLETQKGWDMSSCPRQVRVNGAGEVVEGHVAEGEILAIHSGAQLRPKPHTH